jgi:hypothetical protein
VNGPKLNRCLSVNALPSVVGSSMSTLAGGWMTPNERSLASEPKTELGAMWRCLTASVLIRFGPTLPAA